jgi:hypothetical protein
MTQANPENYLFGYSYTGGLPPASMEVLVIGKNGLAQYVAGHPWPKQPPFDEIGIYQRQLSKEGLASLQGMAATARRDFPAGEPKGLSPDSGTETFFVPQTEGVWRASWNPLEPPTGLVELIRRMRALISELRGHPLSSLHACLIQPETGMQTSELWLKLSNRGERPFAFAGFGAPAGERAELRLQYCDQEELNSSRSRSPLQLIQSNPLEGIMDASQELVIGPGEETTLTLKDSNGFLQRRERQFGMLFGLLRVQWKVDGFEDYVEEGWLMPAPLEAG